MKIFAINNFNNKYIPFANNSNGTQPVKFDNETNNDSFHKQDNNKLSNNTKIVIGIALTALLITGICLLKGRGKQKPPTKKETLPTSKVESNNNVEPPVKPDPTSSSEPSTSHIPQKEFSQNPLEQIDEKYHYIHYEVLPLIEKSPEAYYEGLILFEKYGTRTSFQGMDYHTLQHIGMTFPDNPSPKIVDKFMDIFEKFGKGLHLDHEGIINFGDGNNYMTHIAQKGVISSIEQLRNALEKGKKIIWSNDGIDELKNTLTRGENAPFYGNQEVEDILQQFYITAFNNRTPFKDNPDIKALEEKFWNIHRD